MDGGTRRKPALWRHTRATHHFAGRSRVLGSGICAGHFFHQRPKCNRTLTRLVGLIVSEGRRSARVGTNASPKPIRFVRFTYVYKRAPRRIFKEVAKRGTLLPLSLPPSLEDSCAFLACTSTGISAFAWTQRCCSPVSDKLQLRGSAARLSNGAPPGVVLGSTPFETD